MLRQALGWTKPLRYATDDALFRMAARGRDLEDLKDRYKGRPLLVVGNGPSLNRTPLDDFARIPSIGMNKIDFEGFECEALRGADRPPTWIPPVWRLPMSSCTRGRPLTRFRDLPARA